MPTVAVSRIVESSRSSRFSDSAARRLSVMSSMIQIVPSPVARGFTAFAASRAQNRVPSLRRSSSSDRNASPRASTGPASAPSAA